MLDYYEALHELLNKLQNVGEVEIKPLLQATNHILAEDILTQYDAPLFDNSAMDGYALGGDISHGDCWQIVNRIAAGDTGEIGTLQTGQAVRIFTGAPIPNGTTAVVQQEHTTVETTTLRLTQTVVQGQNIRRQGEELKKGGLLLAANQSLTPAMIGLLASQGYSQLKIFKPLRISIFSTGNELIDPDQTLLTGKIYDANRYLLLSWLQQSGHNVVDGGILPDNQQQTVQALAEAAQQADVIITSGGVSVGEEDHVKAAITQLGELVFWKLAIKPGKPFAWGAIGDSKVFMLPGNPVGSLVTFQQLVIPALRVLAGELPAKVMPHSLVAKANFIISKSQGRREFVRVELYSDDNGYWAKKLPNQGSAMLATCVQANALAEIPANTIVTEGDLLRIYPLQYKV